MKINEYKVKINLNQLNEEFSHLTTRLKACHTGVKLNEAMGLSDELGKLLRVALFRYEAAKKGLALANKLRNPDAQQKHKSRVMSNMNVLRAMVGRMETLLN